MGDFKRGGFGGGRSGGFKKGGFSGGRGGFGGSRGGFGGGRDSRGPVEMFPAVCAECGKNCKVPFRPSNDKPIYCNDCFGSKRDSQPRSDFRGRDRVADFAPKSTGNEELNRKIESIEKKLDTIIDLLGEIEIVDEEVDVKEKAEKKSKKK
jgi:CxxC-x17-CxxC domain-containing protein